MKELLKQILLEKVNTNSKLSEEQIKHFKKKGKFSAVYKPYTTRDLSESLRYLEGKNVTIYCNYETVPCIDAPKFFGQYKFFIEGKESSGWCPEMEFEDIKIIDEIADANTWDCDHNYVMIINNRTVAKKELGNYGKTCNLPLIIGRVYGSKQHEYFKSLAKAEMYMYKYKDEEWKEI